MKEHPILFSAPMVRAILDGKKTQTRRVIKKVLPVGAVDPKGYWGPLDSECIMDHDYLPSSLEMIAADTTTHRMGGKLVGTDLCPYGMPGDRLWVKERWWPLVMTGLGDLVQVTYRADNADKQFTHAVFGDDWNMPKAADRGDVTPLFMPRWASRITLEITDVRVERLQDISEEDAIAEGIQTEAVPYDPDNFHPPGSYGFISGLHLFPQGTLWQKASEAYAELWDSINAKKHPWSSNPWVWAVTFKRVA